MEFEILILGSDANAYYMARCTHEAYNKKAYLIGKEPLSFTKYSNILNIQYEKRLWDEEQFVKTLNQFAITHKTKKILTISTNETYIEFLIKNREKLAKNLIYSSPNLETLLSLTNKEQFYKTYKNSLLEFPETIYFISTSFL